MKLAPKTRLGPYEITVSIGAGGMGEVYKARDTRLDRDVAIKVLPAELAQNAQFRLRFEREAKTISSLNHPHICTLHDIGEDNGIGYLVLELIDGQSLADRLEKGPLPIADVLKVGTQIAEALDRAHRAGVVHRDLKPGNVMITKSGAKLLDFGLARSAAAAVELDGATVQKPLTQEGTILGTFQYMSPEQLEGQEADARTDIFALGAVLYEMATGRRAFEGKTKTSLIAAIVGGEPTPISQLQPLTPPALQHVVDKCLVKDAEDRWQSAHDVAEELKWIGEAGSQAGVAAPVAQHRRRTRTVFTGAVAALIAAAIAVATTYYVTESRRMPLRLAIAVSEPLRMVGPSAGGAAAVAPDGRSVVFVGKDPSGTARLYVRRLEDFEPRVVPLTEGATHPFWSPDGKAIAFFSGGKLRRVELSGAPPIVVGDAPDGRGGTWSRRGELIYAPGISTPLMSVSASGGTAHPVTQLGGGDRSHRYPSAFPDGDHILYFVQSVPATAGIWVRSLTSGRAKRLVEADAAGFVSGNDEILYVRDGVLLAQHIDLKELVLKGEASPVAHGIAVSSDRKFPILSAAAGTVVFQSGSSLRSTFTWFDRQGSNLSPVGPDDQYSEPTFTAHESKVVVLTQPPAVLREIDLASGRIAAMTFRSDEAYQTPAATADRSRVICVATVGGKPALVEIVPGKERSIIGQFRKTKYPDYFDAAGEVLLLEGEREDGRGDFDVFLARRSTGFKLEPLLDSPKNESHAQLSPDGKFVAYSSDESGRAEVYVQPVPPTGERWQVSNAGGDQGQWRGDGKELFYLTIDAKIASVPVKGTSPFETGEPVMLFATRISPASVLGERNQYLARADGQRFLVLDPVQSRGANELSVITNWKH